MRRLRAGLVTPPPGRLGQPSDLTKKVCLQWLDRSRMNRGGSPGDQVGHRALLRTLKARSRGEKSPRWSAERRARFAKRAPRLTSVETKTCAFRRSAPLVGRKEWE